MLPVVVGFRAHVDRAQEGPRSGVNPSMAVGKEENERLGPTGWCYRFMTDA